MCVPGVKALARDCHLLCEKYSIIIARYEGFYASVIFAWLSSSWLLLTVEDCSNKGRIDMSVDTEGTIYLIEFKVEMPLY